MIIAVDGPAAAGKGTLARALARHYNYHFLDTGSLYRMVGLAVLSQGRDPRDAAAALAAAKALRPDLVHEQDRLQHLLRERFDVVTDHFMENAYLPILRREAAGETRAATA